MLGNYLSVCVIKKGKDAKHLELVETSTGFVLSSNFQQTTTIKAKEEREIQKSNKEIHTTRTTGRIGILVEN